MPIIYVHGVNTRNTNHFDPVKEYLQRIVAPAISKDPAGVLVIAADWFQYCDPPKWGGLSRPRTELLGHGAATDDDRTELVAQILKRAAGGAQAVDPFTSGQTEAGARVRLERLDPDSLSDLLALAAGAEQNDELERARISIAADRIAHDSAIQADLRSAPDLDRQLDVLARGLATYPPSGGGSLLAQGAADWARTIKDRVDEGVSRLAGSPAVAASVLAGELRPGLNDLVTRFLGDVLIYQTRRGTAAGPGKIPQVFVDALRLAADNKAQRGGEPIVVLTHSMGGQIVYDAVTTFLPALAPLLKVDFWCAAASQVGFFEELDLFLASDPIHYSKRTNTRTPFPGAHVSHWLNIWDHKDILSFTTRGIFDGVDDREYDTGESLVSAHGGYLERPSFYRQLADRLHDAFGDLQ